MDKKLKLSSKNKILTGVCGGFGEFFNIDPTIVRIIWVLSCFIFFTSFFMFVIAYIFCFAIIPGDNN